jgi:2-hydroxy-6-oxonona-2,4-dienedioate hydrolase
MELQYSFDFKEKDGMKYWDEGNPDAVAVTFLHGILGDVQNFKDNVTPLVDAGYRVIVPLLPCYGLPIRESNVPGLAVYANKFISAIGRPKVHIVGGNSLGGQVALNYLKHHPDQADGLILAGSSGIREMAMRGEFFRIKSDDFIKSRAELTFHDADKHCNEHFLHNIKKIVNNKEYAVRLIAMARSSSADLVEKFLAEITHPTLIAWGANDQLTPPDVAEDFHKALVNSELHFVDECGHAPMMEHPEWFNAKTIDWLNRTF